MENMSVKKELDYIMQTIDKEVNLRYENTSEEFKKAYDIWDKKVEFIEQLGPHMERGHIVKFKNQHFIIWDPLDGFYGFDDLDNSDRYNPEICERRRQSCIKSCYCGQGEF
jgi:hypothetical protein